MVPPRWLPLLLALAVLVPGLGAIDLWAPDEPRYAQVSEELRSLEHGTSGLLVLHLGGEVYTQKPPLYYWLAALVGSTSGHVNEWAARAPSVLAGLGCVLGVQIFGARLFALPGVGTWAALVLVSLLRFVHQARRAQLDVLLAFFELIALSAAWVVLHDESPSSRRTRRWLLVLHGCIALALLTKGPVGALPYGVLLVFLAWEGRLRDARRLFPLWGILVALGPIAAWLVACVALAPPGFFTDAVFDNLVARFFTGTAHIRPFYYYARQLPLDLLPWTPWLAVAGVAAWRRQREPTVDQGESSALRLLLSWAIGFVVFFSLSSGKRGLYLLPAFPAFALLGGWLLARTLAAGRLPRGLETSITTLVAIAGAGGVAVALGVTLPAPVPPLTTFGIALAGVGALFVPTAIGLRLRGGAPNLRAAVMIIAIAALEVSIFVALYPALDEEKSPRPLAEAVTQLTSAHDRVGVYRHSALLGGLEYYSGRRGVALESPEDIVRFVADGGRVVVARAHRADEAARVMAGRPRAAVRHGSRRLVVIETDVDRSRDDSVAEDGPQVLEPRGIEGVGADRRAP